MSNFTELFNGCHAANDMAKFYLENAEKMLIRISKRQ